MAKRSLADNGIIPAADTVIPCSNYKAGSNRRLRGASQPKQAPSLDAIASHNACFTSAPEERLCIYRSYP